MAHFWRCCRLMISDSLLVCRIPNTRSSNNIYYALMTNRAHLAKYNTCIFSINIWLLSVLMIEWHREQFSNTIKSLIYPHQFIYFLPMEQKQWYHSYTNLVEYLHDMMGNNSFKTLIPWYLYFILLLVMWDLATSPSPCDDAVATKIDSWKDDSLHVLTADKSSSCLGSCNPNCW